MVAVNAKKRNSVENRSVYKRFFYQDAISPAYRRVYRKCQDGKRYLSNKQQHLQSKSNQLQVHHSFKLPITALRAFQRYQDEKHYQGDRLLILVLISQMRYLLSNHSFSNPFISKYSLFAKNIFFKSPTKDKTKPNPKNISTYKELLYNFTIITILPPKPALKRSILSLTIWYLAFKTSNLNFLSLIFLSYRSGATLTYYIFDAIERFGFDVVIEPRFYPSWNFILFFPITTNRFWIESTHIGKLFDCEITAFQFHFKCLKIHCKPLKGNDLFNCSIKELQIITLCVDNKGNFCNTFYIIKS